jgi:uncharacterized protein
MTIDLFEFARQQQTVTGELPITSLTRIETPDREGSLTWSARGSIHGRHGALRLDLAVDGSIAMICQRCLQPMKEPLHIVSKFLIADDEAQADLLDQDDDFDVVVGSKTFEIETLIEDEVILALPSAPRHRVCPAGLDGAVLKLKKPSPFAALAALKTGGSVEANVGAEDDVEDET